MLKLNISRAQELLNLSETSIDLAGMYWTLR